MTMQQHGTVVGVFSDQEKARSAVRAVRDAGFRENQIGIASSNHTTRTHGATEDDDTGDESYSGEGALTGAAAGAGVGALWGLGILAGVLPAIGPAIAGGTLAVILSSAAAGAAAAGLAGALIGMGMSKEEAEFYEGEMRAGRTIVTVNAGSRRNDAWSILSRFGAYDMTTRDTAMQASSQAPVTASRSALASHAPKSPDIQGDACRTSTTSGTSKSVTAGTGKASGASGRTSAGMNRTSTGESETVQAREEQLHVQKTPVQKGDVTVRKEVRTEHQTIDVPVTREEVVVERRPAGGTASSSRNLAPGQEIRVPVKEEQVNVQKQAVVKEEVAVGKRKVQSTQRVEDTVRKEDIKVESHGDVKVRDERKKR